jgi:hypothetical protein
VAGDTVSGRVRGGAGRTPIALVRVESCPRVSRAFMVAAAEASDGDGAFVIDVPAAALPSATGEQCALRYVVRTRRPDLPLRPAELRVRTTARPHLATARSEADRFLSDWEARHFHIELFDAQMEGGGRLAGRVHRHGVWPSGPIGVTAKCLECWRSTPLAEGRTPQWHDACLWEADQQLSLDPDRGWAPFCFQLPDDLPPAVEARTIAWRYELRAQRHVRHWFDETAALTPLLYEDAAGG